MGIDIEWIRDEKQRKDIINSELARRGYKVGDQSEKAVAALKEVAAKIERIQALDQDWIKAEFQINQTRKELNKINKEMGKLMKGMKKATPEQRKEILAKKAEFLKMTAATKVKLEEVTKNEQELLVKRNADLFHIGNPIHATVPVADSDEKHVTVRTYGEPRQNSDKKLLHHHQLLYKIGGYEPDAGASVCGHRGYYLTGVAVLLEQALINFAMGRMIKENYTPVSPPVFMDKNIMAETAELADFNESLYHVKGSGVESDSDKYLIATSEQPISALHRHNGFHEEELKQPRKYLGISDCFRKEAGSHGKDAWGIFRVHQFKKVEQFIICNPADSWNQHEEMIKTSEEFYKALGLPYRVINLPSIDLNGAAAKKYDLEGWFPTLGRYKELVSCSNCTDYQSRRMEIRFGLSVQKKGGRKLKPTYVHMLNATLCATTRTICAILENYQDEKGVKVPEALVPYMHGIEHMPFVRKTPKSWKKHKLAN